MLRLLVGFIMIMSVVFVGAEAPAMQPQVAQVLQPAKVETKLPGAHQLTIGSYSGSKGAELRGCIKIESYITEKVPQLRVLFAGKETVSDSEGFFTVPLENKMPRFGFLICKNVKQNFVKTNTVRNVGVEPDEAYRYFELEKHGYGNEWQYQERRLSSENPVAPEQCAILLLDPSYVDRVEPWKMPLADNVVKLPSIVLKKNLDNKTLAQASAKSLLLSLDEMPFHETVSVETKRVAENGKVTLSLAK